MKTFLFAVFFVYGSPQIPEGYYPLYQKSIDACIISRAKYANTLLGHPYPNKVGCIHAKNSEEARILVLRLYE